MIIQVADLHNLHGQSAKFFFFFLENFELQKDLHLDSEYDNPTTPNLPTKVTQAKQT